MSILVGIIIGLVLGLTGAGGSIFAVPLLLWSLNLPLTDAIGISLGVVAISALVGVITRLRSGEIAWLPAIVYAIVGSIFSPLGNWGNQFFNATYVLTGFSILTLLVAMRMWRNSQVKPDEAGTLRAGLHSDSIKQQVICRMNQDKPYSIGPRCVAGMFGGAALTGLLSGFFGVGGGFIIVPTLLMLTGISIKQAVASSLFIITAVSGAGFISFLALEQSLNLPLLSLIAAGGAVGMIMAAFIAKKISGVSLQKTFSIAMGAIGILTLVKAWV